MLAITGCGDEGDGGGGSSGSGGSAGSAGSGGSGSGGGSLAALCQAICGDCGFVSGECRTGCEEGFQDGDGFDADACPNEASSLTSCVAGSNSCLTFILDCSTEYSVLLGCLAANQI